VRGAWLGWVRLGGAITGTRLSQMSVSTRGEHATCTTVMASRHRGGEGRQVRGASSVCVRAGSLALGKGTVTQSEVLGLPKAQLVSLVGCECERRRHLLQRRLVGAAPSSQEHDALQIGHQGALDRWNPLQLCLKVGRRAEPARHARARRRTRKQVMLNESRQCTTLVFPAPDPASHLCGARPASLWW
jgi:hypothetical protein